MFHPHSQVENTLSIIISLSSLDPSHQTYHLLQNASKKEFQATSESLRAFIVLATDFDRLSQEGHEQEKRFKIRDVAIQLFNTNFKLGLEYLAQKGYFLPLLRILVFSLQCYRRSNNWGFPL